MKNWFENVVRTCLRSEEKEDEEISVLGWIVKMTDWDF